MSAQLRERLANVMRAEALGVDLQRDLATERIIVLAVDEAGVAWEIGSVDRFLAYSDPEGARDAVARIKNHYAQEGAKP
jgi:hypothetical protein